MTKNRIFNILVFFFHKSVFFFIFAHSLTRNLAKKCLFLPKIALSISFSSFITLLYFTIFYKIWGLQSILNVFSLLNADFSESDLQKRLFLWLHDATRFFPKTTSYLKIVNMIKCLNLMNCPKTISFSCHEAFCSFPETTNDSKW